MTDLLGKRVTLAQHRELLVIAGWLSALLAYACYDAGDHGAAGLTYAGVSNATVQLTLQASRAYARMGDDQARKMLTAGGAVLARLPVPEHPENHFVFDRDKFEFY
ncbi:MAG: hypothetical protein ACRDN0_24340, partial [Trebonia sp.]